MQACFGIDRGVPNRPVGPVVGPPVLQGREKPYVYTYHTSCGHSHRYQEGASLSISGVPRALVVALSRQCWRPGLSTKSSSWDTIRPLHLKVGLMGSAIPGLMLDRAPESPRGIGPNERPCRWSSSSSRTRPRSRP
jgi:hypothetical protein